MAAARELYDDVSDSDDEEGGAALDAVIAQIEDQERNSHTALFRRDIGDDRAFEGASDGAEADAARAGRSSGPPQKKTSFFKPSGKAIRKPWVGITGQQRNMKFMYYFMPILKGYRKMQLQVRRMRKRGEKAKDPEKFTANKQRMLDEQHAKAAPMIKKLLEEMGGLYNKAAQDIVTRGMVVPPQWVEELKDCFEDMPKRSWSEMKKAITKGLNEEPQAPRSPEDWREVTEAVAISAKSDGASISPRGGTISQTEDMDAMFFFFQSIDEAPLAAASIGQVHTGKLRKLEKVVESGLPGGRSGGDVCNDTDVIVKVLYPEIRTYMAADLANLKQAVLLISKLLSMAMKDTIEAVSMELYDNFPRELDFRIESAFMERARANLAKHSPRVILPKLHKHLSSTSILTQQRVRGDTIATLCKRARARASAAAEEVINAGGSSGEAAAAASEALTAAMDAPRKAFMEVLDCLARMIFKDGFFHADPHPGNIMVNDADGRPVLIDWGQCMALDDLQRKTLCELTLLLRTRCIPLIVKALSQLKGSEASSTGGGNEGSAGSSSSSAAAAGSGGGSGGGGDFGFSSGDEGNVAALMYFFFDSQQEGPFAEDIRNMRDLVRYKPTKAGYITALPREVVFFGRVMTSIRRNCEDLQIDVSAIDVFAPFARAALLRILDDMDEQAAAEAAAAAGGKGGGGGESAAAEVTGGGAVEAKRDMWDPSRLLCMLPPDSNAFQLFLSAVDWTQGHAYAADELMALSLRMGDAFFGGGGGGGQLALLNEGGGGGPAARGQAVRKTRATFLIEGLVAGFVGDPRCLRSALASNRTHRRRSRLALLSNLNSYGGDAEKCAGAAATATATSEDVRGAYDDGVLARRILDWAMFFFDGGGDDDDGGGASSTSQRESGDDGGLVSTILLRCGPSALAVATELAAFALPPPPKKKTTSPTTTAAAAGKSTAPPPAVAGGGGFSTLSFKTRVVLVVATCCAIFCAYGIVDVLCLVITGHHFTTAAAHVATTMAEPALASLGLIAPERTATTAETTVNGDAPLPFQASARGGGIGWTGRGILK